MFTCNLIRNGHPAQIVWNTEGDTPYVAKGMFTRFSDLDGSSAALTPQLRIGPKPVLLEAQ
jgi:hypothetical protein